MNLIMLMLMLAILGAITWAIVTYIPMPRGIRTVIVVIAVVAAVIYALNAFGISIPHFPVPRAR